MHKYYAPKESQIGLWVKETITFVVGIGGLIALMAFVSIAFGA